MTEPKLPIVKEWKLEATDEDAPTQREIDENMAEAYDAQRRER